MNIKHSLLIGGLLCLFIGVNAGLYAEDKDSDKSISAFPILMYDSDIGYGYGAKVKFIDYFKMKESFDLIAFNSTKGERWYVLTFCYPDIEIRQRKAYPFSLDVKAEYDKFLKYYYYGTGGDSLKENESVFTFEKTELQLSAGRGFTSQFVMELRYILKNVHYFNIDKERPFTQTLQETGEQFSPFASLLVRYDTSDSQIHPTKGLRLVFQSDFAAGFLGNQQAEYYRATLDFRKYFLLFGNRDVVGIRFLTQKISGQDVPLYELPVLGGGSEMTALRGIGQNCFIDNGKFICNFEYRFPLFKKLGGNIFVDAGSVWPRWTDINFQDIKINAGWGLRYYLKDFVARFDMGFSPEGTGIYFNFGHLF